MQVNTQGLIVTEKIVGESDRLVAVLTKDEGLIWAFVKRARALKNKNSSSTQLFCYSRLNIYKGRDKYIINEAELNEMFFELRQDICKLSLAQYFCELIVALQPQSEGSEEILKLILNAFYLLSKNKIKASLLKPIVELRLMSICGFMPNLVACNFCNIYNAETMFFSIKDSIIYCSDCVQKYNNDSIKLNKGTLAAMRHTIYSEPSKLFNFTVSDDTINQFSNLTEKYVELKLERKFKTLDFYHQISV